MNIIIVLVKVWQYVRESDCDGNWLDNGTTNISEWVRVKINDFHNMMELVSHGNSTMIVLLSKITPILLTMLEDIYYICNDCDAYIIEGRLVIDSKEWESEKCLRFEYVESNIVNINHKYREEILFYSLCLSEHKI